MVKGSYPAQGAKVAGLRRLTSSGGTIGSQPTFA